MKLFQPLVSVVVGSSNKETEASNPVVERVKKMTYELAERFAQKGVEKGSVKLKALHLVFSLIFCRYCRHQLA